MKVLNRKLEIKKEISLCRKKGRRIGFVPTMGFLHSGHISLIDRARRDNDIVIASIFINPTQFNDKKDFDRYPRDLQNDIIILDKHNCDIVFAPTKGEVYNVDTPNKRYDLGGLDSVMEGYFRPDHFQGVAMIIDILLGVVDCDNIYLGEKDYQQLLIIKHLIEKLDYGVEVISVETYREDNGLAYSSRNSLLKSEERERASFLYETLSEVKLEIEYSKEEKIRVEKIKSLVKNRFNDNNYINLEYFEICQEGTLVLEKDYIYKNKDYRAFISAFYEDKVRLIDNLYLG